MRARLLAELERCDANIALCLSGCMERVHPAEDLLGFVDWNHERRLIVKELEGMNTVKIIEPYSRMIAFDDAGHLRPMTRDLGIGLLRKIEWFARISHRSEDAQTDDSWERFITANVLQHGDWSVVEHASVSTDSVIDRGVTHEDVRHRLQSPTQESTRFVNYRKKAGLLGFVAPEFKNEAQRLAWEKAMSEAEINYEGLLDVGFAPEIARDALPHGLAARIGVTNNLRNWRLILLMRTTVQTHPKFRKVSIPLLEEFKANIPLLFDDIEPLKTQAHNLRLPR